MIKEILLSAFAIVSLGTTVPADAQQGEGRESNDRS